MWAVLVTKPILEIKKQTRLWNKEYNKNHIKNNCSVTDLMRKYFSIGTTKVHKLKQQQNPEKSL